MTSPPRLPVAFYPELKPETYWGVNVQFNSKIKSGIYHIERIGPFLLFYTEPPRIESSTVFVANYNAQPPLEEEDDGVTLFLYSNYTPKKTHTLKFQRSATRDKFLNKYFKSLGDLEKVIRMADPSKATMESDLTVLLPSHNAPNIVKLSVKDNTLALRGLSSNNKIGALSIALDNYIYISDVNYLDYRMGGVSNIPNSFVFARSYEDTTSVYTFRCSSVEEAMSWILTIYAHANDIGKDYDPERPLEFIYSISIDSLSEMAKTPSGRVSPSPVIENTDEDKPNVKLGLGKKEDPEREITDVNDKRSGQAEVGLPNKALTETLKEEVKDDYSSTCKHSCKQEVQVGKEEVLDNGKEIMSGCPKKQDLGVMNEPVIKGDITTEHPSVNDVSGETLPSDTIGSHGMENNIETESETLKEVRKDSQDSSLITDVSQNIDSSTKMEMNSLSQEYGQDKSSTISLESSNHQQESNTMSDHLNISEQHYSNELQTEHSVSKEDQKTTFSDKDSGLAGHPVDLKQNELHQKGPVIPCQQNHNKQDIKEDNSVEEAQNTESVEEEFKQESAVEEDYKEVLAVEEEFKEDEWIIPEVAHNFVLPETRTLSLDVSLIEVTKDLLNEPLVSHETLPESNLFSFDLSEYEDTSVHTFRESKSIKECLHFIQSDYSIPDVFHSHSSFIVEKPQFFDDSSANIPNSTLYNNLVESLYDISNSGTIIHRESDSLSKLALTVASVILNGNISYKSPDSEFNLASLFSFFDEFELDKSVTSNPLEQAYSLSIFLLNTRLLPSFFSYLLTDQGSVNYLDTAYVRNPTVVSKTIDIFTDFFSKHTILASLSYPLPPISQEDLTNFILTPTFSYLSVKKLIRFDQPTEVLINEAIVFFEQQFNQYKTNIPLNRNLKAHLSDVCTSKNVSSHLMAFKSTLNTSSYIKDALLDKVLSSDLKVMSELTNTAKKYFCGESIFVDSTRLRYVQKIVETLENQIQLG